MRSDVAHAMVRDELFLDGNARQNLATFCQTYLNDDIHQLMDMSIDKNMIDKDEYPATAELESRCVHILADLWNSPKPPRHARLLDHGSSEACMLGGLALKHKWRARMKAAGKPTDKPNLVTGPVQVCWHKFARYFDVELREIPLERGRIGMTPEEVLKRVDENTIGVMPTFGVTFTCQYEPVAESPPHSTDWRATRGSTFRCMSMPPRADSSRPFVEPDLVWDFRLPRVRSINASGHKFGLAPLGVGWVVWREKADLPEDLIFYVNYLGGNMPTFALNFSRPGGQIISQYYLFLRLGREGYRRIQQNSYDIAQYIAQEIVQTRPVRASVRRRQPQGHSGGFVDDQGWREAGLHAVRSVRPFTHARLAGRRLYHAAQHHRPRGDAPAGPQRLQPRYGRHAAGGYPARSIAHLQKHPVTTPQSAAEGTTFTHHALPKEKLPA